MSVTERFEFATVTDCGRVRSGNEDACGHDASLGIFVVCDGMGGAAAGEVASSMTVQGILDHWRNSATKKPETDAAIRERMRGAISNANELVYKKASHDAKLQGMGTTALMLYLEPAQSLIQSPAKVWLAHVGDSRGYRYRGGKLKQLTLDHSLVEEQVRLGHMTAEQAEHSPFRNVITRAVGAAEQVEADVICDSAIAGDLYLLCTDGLTRELHEKEISTILEAALTGKSKSPLDDACAALVREANAHGGRDNITCILVRVG